MVRAIGNNDSTLESESGFTPASAVRTLPLVRRIMHDIIALSDSINRQREQLRGIDSLDDTIGDRHYQEEVSDIRVSLANDEARLNECTAELVALGVRPHLPIDGSVDFPATFQRRAVRLCWHVDDEDISFWHEVGEAAEQRKRIDKNQFGSDSF